MTSLTLNQHTITVTHANKILFPESNITKLDVINYYVKIAPHLLPHIESRALTIQRFPAGITQKGFIQQHLFEHMPNWFKTAELAKKSGGSMSHLVCQNEASLAYLCEYDMITPHRWLSKVTQADLPDLFIIDIDPHIEQFQLACKAAKYIKELFEQKKLQAFVMTTGSKGLHVIVPFKPKYTFEQTRMYAQQLMQALIQAYPDEFTMEMRKEERAGRVFIDTIRNTYGHTAVAPYGIRALPNAPVATPLNWHELDDPELTAQRFTLKNIFARLQMHSAIWDNYTEAAQQSLTIK